MIELLSTDEMGRADKAAVARGVASLTLMENAGRAVADVAAGMIGNGGGILVVCGPGNNGGDGFVAARLLKADGHDVRVALLGDRAALKGDAAEMARRWDGPVEKASADSVAGTALIVDAVFGAGLTRPLDGEAAKAVAAMNASGVTILAVDVPSGLNGTTGEARGPAVHATQTVTFFRKKPGHLLLPGRALCGEVRVADIGIPDEVLEPSSSPSSPLCATAGSRDARVTVLTFENAPKLWRHAYPWPKLDGHKYARGHAVVVSGPAFQSGAARLAARGALRIGAGLVTVASPPSALPENAAHLTAIMLKPCGSARALTEILSDPRKNVLLIGPGAGVGDDTCEWVEAALASPAAVVLDADALTSFAGARSASDRTSIHFGFTGAAVTHEATPEVLFAAIKARLALLQAGGRTPERGDERAVRSEVGNSPLTHHGPLSPRGEGAGAVVLTPHQGEFKRLFPDLVRLPSKLERAREAAQVSGAVVILKGPDTVIAAPDGRAAINSNAPPWLATAGSGDVLAGLVTGLMAQGMPAFEAACAAAYLHGACGEEFGLGLIAEDIPEILPEILQNLHNAAGGPEWNYAQPSDGDAA